MSLQWARLEDFNACKKNGSRSRSSQWRWCKHPCVILLAMLLAISMQPFCRVGSIYGWRQKQQHDGHDREPRWKGFRQVPAEKVVGEWVVITDWLKDRSERKEITSSTTLLPQSRLQYRIYPMTKLWRKAKIARTGHDRGLWTELKGCYIRKVY
jgi:hypothetical protein